MDNTTPIVCPECGQEVFKSHGKLQSKEDLGNIVCAGCKHKLTDLDIRNELRKIATAQIRKMLRK
jgi:DNA-directed RNA polymerase subunit RPC12/RpoP